MKIKVGELRELIREHNDSERFPLEGLVPNRYFEVGRGFTSKLGHVLEPGDIFVVESWKRVKGIDILVNGLLYDGIDNYINDRDSFPVAIYGSEFAQHFHLRDKKDQGLPLDEVPEMPGDSVWDKDKTGKMSYEKTHVPSSSNKTVSMRAHK